jgi:phosphatidylinositol 4-kinase A
MKPLFERTVNMVIASLGGKAREFYEREFGFFDQVTSISKKLQPYIKKTKAEKKAGSFFRRDSRAQGFQH